MPHLTPIITTHAFQRAKERVGWNQDATIRMAGKALNDGVAHGDTRGRLNRYLTKLYLDEHNASNIRIYGEHVFLFAGQTLITILHLPHDMRVAARRSA